jgi:hypothetical protein
VERKRRKEGKRGRRLCTEASGWESDEHSAYSDRKVRHVGSRTVVCSFDVVYREKMERKAGIERKLEEKRVSSRHEDEGET